MSDFPYAKLQDAAVLRFLTTPGASLQRLAVYHVVNRLRKSGIRTSNAAIGRALGMPRETVSRSIAWLSESGFIVQRDGQWKAVEFEPINLRSVIEDGLDLDTVLGPDRDAGVTQKRDVEITERDAGITVDRDAGVTLGAERRDAGVTHTVTHESRHRDAGVTPHCIVETRDLRDPPPPVGETPARDPGVGREEEEDETDRVSKPPVADVERARRLVQGFDLEGLPWVRFLGVPPSTIKVRLERVGFVYAKDAHGFGGVWECRETRFADRCREALRRLLGDLADLSDTPAPAAPAAPTSSPSLPDAAPHLAELWDRVDGELAARFGSLHAMHFAGLYPVSRDGDALVVAHPDEMSALLVVGYLPALSEVVSAAAGERISVRVWSPDDTAAEGAARRAS